MGVRAWSGWRAGCSAWLAVVAAGRREEWSLAGQGSFSFAASVLVRSDATRSERVRRFLFRFPQLRKRRSPKREQASKQVTGTRPAQERQRRVACFRRGKVPRTKRGSSTRQQKSPGRYLIPTSAAPVCHVNSDLPLPCPLAADLPTNRPLCFAGLQTPQHPSSPCILLPVPATARQPMPSDVSVPPPNAPVDPSPFARIDCRLAFHLGPRQLPRANQGPQSPPTILLCQSPTLRHIRSLHCLASTDGHLALARHSRSVRCQVSACAMSG